MANYQQDSFGKGRHKDKLQNQEADSLNCSNCQALNEDQTLFCSECGEMFKKACPHCQHKNPLGADICEGCGEWLLEGQCRFCYEPYEEGQSFCEQCGNPPEGIVCSQCNQVSYFDFCKNCEIPLNAQAQEAIQELQADPDFQILAQLIPKEDKSEPQDSSTQEDASKKAAEAAYKAYLAQFEEENLASKKLIDRKIKFGKPDIGNLSKQIQQSEKKQASKKKSAPQKQLPKDYEERFSAILKKKKFKNKQEARRFFCALKVVMPVKRRRTIGWQCNLSNMVHPYPNHCAAPERGGRFIYEEYTDYNEFKI